MTTVRMAKKLIEYGWLPVQKGGWIRFGSHPRAGTTITFKGHENHIVYCSNDTAKELLNTIK